jgi:hypothetical protein
MLSAIQSRPAELAWLKNRNTTTVSARSEAQVSIASPSKRSIGFSVAAKLLPQPVAGKGWYTRTLHRDAQAESCLPFST